MKNIAIDLMPITDGVTKGGVGRFLECLVPELIGLGSGKFYFFKRKDIGIPVLNDTNNEIVDINFINTIIWQQVQLPFYLYKLNIDILFSMYEILPIIKPRNIKFVTYLFEEPSHRHKIAADRHALNLYSRLSWSYINILSKMSFSRTDFIACASNATLREMVNRYNCADKTEVIPSGINNIFKKEHSKEYVAKALLKYDINTRYIFSLSSDDPRNNTESIIISFSELRKRTGYNDCLILGGRISNRIRNRFMEIAEKHGCHRFVRVIGYISDSNEIASLYKGCDLYIELPLFEGFGFQVVEAAAMGAPIVCSDIAPLNENIKDSALFSDPHNIEDIINSMEKILGDERLKTKLTDKHKEIQDRFDWKKAALELIKVFNNIHND